MLMRIQDKYTGANILITIGVLTLLLSAQSLTKGGGSAGGLIFGPGILFAAIAYKLAKKRILSDNLSKAMLIGEISSIIISLYLLFFLTPSLEYIFRFLAQQGFSPIIWLMSLIAYFFTIFLAKKDDD